MILTEAAESGKTRSHKKRADHAALVEKDNCGLIKGLMMI